MTQLDRQTQLTIDREIKRREHYRATHTPPSATQIQMLANRWGAKLKPSKK